MNPMTLKKFDPFAVRDCIKRILLDTLEGKIYSEDLAKSEWLVKITDEISAQTKEMNFHRTRIIVSVTLGKCGSAEAVASLTRSIWDSETDAYTSYTFHNGSIFCIALVYGVYLY